MQRAGQVRSHPREYFRNQDRHLILYSTLGHCKSCQHGRNSYTPPRPQFKIYSVNSLVNGMQCKFWEERPGVLHSPPPQPRFLENFINLGARGGGSLYPPSII